MRIYRRNKYNENYWKKYGKLIPHPYYKCCGRPTILVRYSSGGFIKHICLQCGKLFNFSNNDFFRLDYLVACPFCNKTMSNEKVYGNYSFVCSQCQIYIELADFLVYIDSLQAELRNSKQTPGSSNKVVLNLCLDCVNFHKNDCPGPNISFGSYRNINYFCSSFSRKRQNE